MDFYPKYIIDYLSLITTLVIFSRSFAYGADSIVTNREFQNHRVIYYAQPLNMTCNTTTPSPDTEFKWFKDDKPLHTSEGDKPNIVVKGGVVIVNRAMEDDVANYTCTLFNTKTKTNISSAEFIVVGRPYVKLPETATVIEGEKLKLECIVIGSPPPTVEWIVGNVTYDKSEGRVKMTSSRPDGALNILELEPAQMSDRGDISCTANNIATSIGDHKAMVVSTYVRVKDKYAAVWPFLGIVAEVVVLCTVIFIYEKKRNTAELEESDTDQSPEQKNTPDHGKDSIRQRK